MEPEKKPPLRVFLNEEEEIAYDREKRRRQEGETHGDLLPLKKGEDGGIDFAVPQFLRDMYNSVTLPRDAAKGYKPTEDEIAQFALDMGTGGTTSSAALAGDVGPDAVGMFLGRKAKDAPIEALYDAITMTEKGATRDDVWKSTGWWKGWDGNWRFEVSDETTQLKPEIPGMMKEGLELDLEVNRSSPGWDEASTTTETAFTGRVQDFLDAENLEGRYGDGFADYLGEIDAEARLTNAEGAKQGYFTASRTPSKRKMGVMADDVDELRPLFIHELQHAIQQLEKHSSGTSPIEIARTQKFVSDFLINDPDYQLRSDLIKTLDEASTLRDGDLTDAQQEELVKKVGQLAELNEELAPLDDAIERFMKKYSGDVHYKYRSSAGEVEANLSEARRDMTDAERRARPPWLYLENLGEFDVKEEDIYLIEDFLEDKRHLQNMIEGLKFRRGYSKGGTAMKPDEQLPPGAIPSDVADDVPANLSEGEYVIPAPVVRFLGLDKIEKMVKQAEEQLAQMEADGRIGGEPVQDEEDPELPFSEEELVGYASGGMVEGKDSTSGLPQEGGFTGTRQFKGPDGTIMYVPFYNGSPLFTIPSGYTPISQDITPEAPDPNKSLPEYKTQAAMKTPKAEGASHGPRMPPSRLAGDPEDWTVQDFINYGKQDSGPEKKLFQGIVSLMPGGKLAFKARDRYLSKKTGELFDQMLDTNKDLQGKELTPEMRRDLVNTKNKLAGDLSKEAGVEISPMDRISGMIDRFTGFVTGNPVTPMSSSSSTSSTPRSSMNPEATRMLGSYSKEGDTFRPGNTSDNQTSFQDSVPKTEADRQASGAKPDTMSHGGLYRKGGLVQRRNK